MGERARVGPGDHLMLGGVDGQLRECHGEQRDVIRRGVRPRVARPQQAGERFAGGVEEREQRMEPEAVLVVRRRAFLLGMRGDERCVEVDHVEPRVFARSPRLGSRVGSGQPKTLVSGRNIVYAFWISPTEVGYIEQVSDRPDRITVLSLSDGAEIDLTEKLKAFFETK